MDASELRLGNWINLKDKGCYKIETGHDIDEISDWINDTNYCTPISLTEEWLIKFGFKKKSDYEANFYNINSFVIKGGGFFYLCLGNTNIPLKEIKYVHHLQNLYMDLTGKELTIK